MGVWALSFKVCSLKLTIKNLRLQGRGARVHSFGFGFSVYFAFADHDNSILDQENGL